MNEARHLCGQTVRRVFITVLVFGGVTTILRGMIHGRVNRPSVHVSPHHQEKQEEMGAKTPTFGRSFHLGSLVARRVLQGEEEREEDVAASPRQSAPAMFAPFDFPTAFPTARPSESQLPSSFPTDIPTRSSSPSPPPSISHVPSPAPSVGPSVAPTSSAAPSSTVSPSVRPSQLPSLAPSYSFAPSAVPTESPSDLPSVIPSFLPSLVPSYSWNPSTPPSRTPSLYPTVTVRPSLSPSSEPSLLPSQRPSLGPSTIPSTLPTDISSISPTVTLDRMVNGSLVMLLSGVAEEVIVAQRQWEQETSNFVMRFWNDQSEQNPFAPVFVGSVTTRLTNQRRIGNLQETTSAAGTKDLEVAFQQTIEYGDIRNGKPHEFLEPFNETIFLLPFQSNAWEFTNLLVRITESPNPIAIKDIRFGKLVVINPPSTRRYDAQQIWIIALSVIVVSMVLACVASFLFYRLKHEHDENFIMPTNAVPPSRDPERGHTSTAVAQSEQLHGSESSRPPVANIPVMQPPGFRDDASSTDDRRSSTTPRSPKKLSRDEFMQALEESGEEEATLEGMVIRSSFPTAVTPDSHIRGDNANPGNRDSQQALTNAIGPLASLNTIMSQSPDHSQTRLEEDTSDSTLPQMTGFQMEVIELDD